MRVEIYPFAHAFRAGQQDPRDHLGPGGDKPVWSFVTLDGTQDERGRPLARACRRPWSCPVVPGIDVPDAAAGLPGPPGPALPGVPARGQLTRTPATVSGPPRGGSGPADAGRRTGP